MIKERRYHKIIPHDKGIGFVAIEYIYKHGKKNTLWTSCNHFDECLCELEIKRRKETVEKVQSMEIKQTYPHKYYDFGHRDKWYD